MARLPKKRVSYLEDGNFLIRLSRSIELDDTKNPEWKREALGHLSALIIMFTTDAGQRAHDNAIAHTARKTK